MSRPVPVAVVQAAQLAATEPLDRFASDVAAHRRATLVLYPELHLCGIDRTGDVAAQIADAAEPLDGPRGKALAELAGDLGIWLQPGSVYERGAGGELFNTALLYSPQGELAASYRKMFPWRPYETCTPGDRFVVVDAPGIGRIGLSICYDAWFPELFRHLAWMGAEVILNPTRTTTCDRAQEVVLARANAIVNQVFVVSANAAGPDGVGHSLVVDPEGRVRTEAPGATPAVLTDVLDLDAVATTRKFGTAGLNRMWSQFSEADRPIDLPLYEGRIDPARWAPPS